MSTSELKRKNKLGGGEIFKISRFKEYIKKTVPHKHDDYHELIFLRQGEGFHTIEENKFMVAAPDFYYLQPGQLHFWQFTDIPKGFVILFKRSFFDEITDVKVRETYLALGQHKRIVLTEENYPDRILEEMFACFKEDGEYSELMIKGLLVALFGRLLTIAPDMDAQTEKLSSKFEQFQSLLLKHVPKLKRAKEFANLLNVTPQYLNTICKKETNRTATELINEQILLEIKRYLLHTELTVGEIVDAMEFSDDSNFVKFFKGKEHCTPLQFRNRYFQ